MLSVPMTVVETPGFIRDASAALTDGERTDMIFFLAANPEAGDFMAQTGGGRKFRWKAQDAASVVVCG